MNNINEILSLEDSKIKNIIKECPQRVLAICLKYASADVKLKIEFNLSERARLILKEDITDIEEVTPEDLINAQQRLFSIIKNITE